MIKQDKEILWRPGRLYIPAWQFSGLDYEATTAIDIKSMGTGAANDTAVAEINTSGVTGVSFGANANSLEHFLAVPYDMDLKHPIYFSAVWTANNTSGSVTWDVLYKRYVANSTVLGSAVSATVLDKTLGLQSMAGVAYTVMVTGEGRLNGGTLANDTEYLQLGVVKTTVATITTAYLIGLNIRYTPKRLVGQGSLTPAKPNLFITSDTF